MTTLTRDVRHAVRRLLRDRGFTVVAGLILALTLGANTAVFTVMNGVLLRALPFPEPDRIVDVAAQGPPVEGRPTSKSHLDSGTVAAWRESHRTIEQVAVYRRDAFVVTGHGAPRRVRGARVSAELFSLLGVPPLLGRTFDGETQRSESTDKVAVLSYGFWQRHFAGDREILGEVVTLDGEPYTVVAVQPRSFFFPERETELWVPLEPPTVDPASGEVIQIQYFPTVARLADGASAAQARAEVQAILRASGGITGMSSYRAEVVPLRDEMVAEVRPALLALFAAVGLVLLIGCANLANLVLARTISREREIAVRVAMGGGRGHVVRQVLTETTVLALAGGVVGLLLALGIHELLPQILPSNLPRLEEVRLDTRVFLFAFGLSVVTGLLFGLWPALRSAKTSPVEALRGSRGGGVEGRRSRQALLVAEVALAVVLLIGAGLLLRSFLRLVAVEPGYEPERVMTATLELDRSRYPDPTRMEAFFDQLLSRLENQPAVEAAGVVSYPPLTSSFSLETFEVVGGSPGPALAVPQRTSPGYLRAAGMRLVAGRWLTEHDHANRTPTAVVNQTFVREVLGGEDALGERLRVGSATVEIVGVVEDVKLLNLTRDPLPELFTSYRIPGVGSGPERLTLLVRTVDDPRAVIPLVRSVVTDLDPGLPPESVGTLRDRLSDSVARPRFYAELLGLFALLALLLAMAGIYGVLAYHVAQRSREIAVRRALGAQRSNILRAVLREGLALVVVGLGLGLLAAAGVTRVLSSLLFETPRMDPWTYGLVPALLVAVAALACYLPARRATRVEPMAALRWE
jgi:putative ABC transport system permease protein